MSDLRILGPVVDRNMLLIEELSNELVPGNFEREALLKRFIFKAFDCFFVYTSSVPDTVHSDDESGRDDVTRYTMIFSIMCFKKDVNDLILERLMQIDFR